MERWQGVFDGLRPRLQDQLAVAGWGSELELLGRWARLCPGLSAADLSGPQEVVGWVWSLPTTRADQVLRGLVSAAQAGDRAAALVVILCLEPGICRIVTSQGWGRHRVDEVVSELVVQMYEFPVERRRAVAAGLLWAVRSGCRRGAVEERRCVPAGLRPDLPKAVNHNDVSVPWGSTSGGRSAIEQLISLVSEALRDGVLGHREARLIVETRVMGERCSVVARRLGLAPRAGYRCRARAEAKVAIRYDAPDM